MPGQVYVIMKTTIGPDENDREVAPFEVYASKAKANAACAVLNEMRASDYHPSYSVEAVEFVQ